MRPGPTGRSLTRPAGTTRSRASGLPAARNSASASGSASPWPGRSCAGPILLLDGPTGAMGPLAEADWHECLRWRAAGRTVLLVTHRFTTAVRADMIHVMAEGRAAEPGSHQELVARGGLYARSWAAQMRGEAG